MKKYEARAWLAFNLSYNYERSYNHRVHAAHASKKGVKITSHILLV